MFRNKHKIINIGLILLIIISAAIITFKVGADSGWDTSYDSGSSWSSSSSWDSGSSWDSSGTGGFMYNLSPDERNLFLFIFFLIFAIPIVIFIY